MNYQEFNSKVFEFYRSRASSPFCTLGISSNEFECILSPDLIRDFSCLKRSWDGLLIKIEGKPQYFGLIAIQCYASVLMENDKQATSAAYNFRLATLLGLSDAQKLQQIFGYKKDGYAIQELLWISAQSFILECWHQTLIIPEISSYAWKYVRYPKYQALLNKQDLHQFLSFFYTYFRMGEQLDYNFFKQFIKLNLKRSDLSRRAITIFEDPLRKESAIGQLFNFFYKWSGEIYAENMQQGGTMQVPEEKLMLQFINGLPEFFLYPSLEKVNSAVLFQNPFYRSIHKQIKIFNQLDYYPGQFEDSRFLYLGSECYVLIDKYTHPSLHQFLLENQLSRITLSDGVDLFCFLQVSSSIHPAMQSYVSAYQRISLRGGLKLSRRKCYLVGFGPDIISEDPFFVFCNEQPIAYQSNSALAGLYKVRSSNSCEVIFEILEVELQNGCKTSSGAGWDLKDWTISNHYVMEGGMLLQDKNHEEPLNEWIALQNRQLSNQKSTYQNILLQTLKYAHAKKY